MTNEALERAKNRLRKELKTSMMSDEKVFFDFLLEYPDRTAEDEEALTEVLDEER